MKWFIFIQVLPSRPCEFPKHQLSIHQMFFSVLYAGFHILNYTHACPRDLFQCLSLWSTNSSSIIPCVFTPNIGVLGGAAYKQWDNVFSQNQILEIALLSLIHLLQTLNSVSKLLPLLWQGQSILCYSYLMWLIWKEE